MDCNVEPNACPVVLTIRELYGSYDYESSNSIDIIQHDNRACMQVNIDYVLFYVTKQKMEFARFELNAKKLITESQSITESTIPRLPELYTKYIDCYRDYFGSNSQDICEIITKESFGHLYRTFTYAADILAILEDVCSVCDFPDGMSIPDITINNAPLNTLSLIIETNKLISYANVIVVGGIKASEEIQHVNYSEAESLEFPRPDIDTPDYIESARMLLAADMKLADSALKMESAHVEAIKKLTRVIELEQKIIDNI